MKSALAIAALAATASALPQVARSSSSKNSTAPAAIHNPQVWSDLRGKIKHVVYLMLENHSFDNIAGYWDFNDDINNLR